MHARSLWANYVTPAHSGVALSRRDARGLVVAYAAAYAWRHYGKSIVQRRLLTALGWPRWVYKRVKRGVLLCVYGVLVTARRIGITPVVERLLGRSKTEARERNHA
jgi:hypothetical protein